GRETPVEGKAVGGRGAPADRQRSLLAQWGSAGRQAGRVDRIARRQDGARRRGALVVAAVPAGLRTEPQSAGVQSVGSGSGPEQGRSRSRQDSRDLVLARAG